MAKIIQVLPWIFICISLAYVIFRYEKNNNIAKEYYIIEGMTFYLIVCTLLPETKSAEELLNEVRAFKGFPKSKHDFFGLDCIVQKAHISETEESELSLKCSDGNYLIIDEIQPAGRKIMDAKSFLNGYKK